MTDLQQLKIADLPQANILAVGTVSEAVSRSSQFRDILEEYGIDDVIIRPMDSLERCVDIADWHLTVVLSPFKRRAGEFCTSLSPVAKEIGVVDTIIRRGTEIVGYNTNVAAIEKVLRRLIPPDCIDGVIQVVGTGATARCVIAAAQNSFAHLTVAVVGRNFGNVAALAGESGALALEVPATENVVITVHTTSWGETPDSEQVPLMPDLKVATHSGQVLFDLNNRVSTLQTDSLGRGCIVIGGKWMQEVVHRQRAILLRELLDDLTVEKKKGEARDD